MKRPACMTDDEWVGWTEVNRSVNHAFLARTPCSDCLHGFALEMRAQDRCDGIPLGHEDDASHNPWQYSDEGIRRRVETRRRNKAKRAAVAVALHRQGLRNVDIAKRLGYAESTVSQYIREFAA